MPNARILAADGQQIVMMTGVADVQTVAGAPSVFAGVVP